MRSLVVAAAAGALFGAGLLVSGMTAPAKVVGFLDVTRGWEPSLAFVMGGAVLVYGMALRWIRVRRARPCFDVAFHLPTRRGLAQHRVGAAINQRARSGLPPA